MFTVFTPREKPIKDRLYCKSKFMTTNNRNLISIVLLGLSLLILAMESTAHGVDESTRAFLQTNTGANFIPFLYIGAKHMITGYDHILFLIGVIFFLHKNKDILLYVSMFTLGHSLTLMTGVLANIQLNAYIIDAIIGFSIVYKGFENIGGFRRFFSIQVNTKIAVLVFGLFHGFGLATKIQEFKLPTDGLLENLIAFNIGVELGQFTALAIILIVMNVIRRHASFNQFSTTANVLLMASGFTLMGYQLTGYFVN